MAGSHRLSLAWETHVSTLFAWQLAAVAWGTHTMFLFLLLMLLMHPSSLQWVLRHRLEYLAAPGASEACQTMRAWGQRQSINTNAQRLNLICSSIVCTVTAPFRCIFFT